MNRSIQGSSSKSPGALFPHLHLQALFGVPGGVSRPDGICNPTSMRWVCPEVSYQLDVPSISPQLNVFTSILMSCPTTLNGFFFLNARSSSFSLNSIQLSNHPVLKGKQSTLWSNQNVSGCLSIHASGILFQLIVLSQCWFLATQNLLFIVSCIFLF